MQKSQPDFKFGGRVFYPPASSTARAYLPIGDRQTMAEAEIGPSRSSRMPPAPTVPAIAQKVAAPSKTNLKGDPNSKRAPIANASLVPRMPAGNDTFKRTREPSITSLTNDVDATPKTVKRQRQQYIESGRTSSEVDIVRHTGGSTASDDSYDNEEIDRGVVDSRCLASVGFTRKSFEGARRHERVKEPRFKSGRLVNPTQPKLTLYLRQLLCKTKQVEGFSASPSSDRLSATVFVKVIRKQSYREANAYTRTHEQRMYIFGENGRRVIHPFVLPLEAFMDFATPDLQAQILAFSLCQMDMAQALQKYCPAHGADPKDLAYFRGNLRLWLGQTAFGIHYLHCIGIIHRDIKLENRLLDFKDNVVITDLGLAFTHADAKLLKPTIGYSRTPIGTPDYMAPEIDGETEYSTPVDWWAFGIVTLELANHNRVALHIETVIKKYMEFRQARSDTRVIPDSMQFFKSYVSETSLCDVLWFLLHPDPSLRYSFIDLYDHEYFQDQPEGDDFEDDDVKNFFEEIVETSLNRPHVHSKTHHPKNPILKYPICSENARYTWVSPVSTLMLPPLGR